MRLLFVAVLSIVAVCAQNYSVHTVAGGGLPENTPCAAANLGIIVTGLAADAAGNLFIAATNDNIVVRCDAATGMLTRVAGTGIPGFSSGDNVPATSVRLNNPTALALDPAGNLYIAETGRVRKVSGGIITTIAGIGIAGFSGDGGRAVDAQINPAAIAVDPSGNVYISDAAGYRIRRVANGVITTVAGVGQGVIGATGDGVPALSAQIGAPSSIAADAAGNLYLAMGKSGVRKIANGVITTVTTAVIARAVAVDPSGNLFVLTTSQAFAFSGGSLVPFGPVDDVLTSNAIAADGSGNVYYPDGYEAAAVRARIRRVSNGSITTVAGGAYRTSENGPATSAQLAVVAGVAVDAAGDVYFSETDGNRVRKLSNGVLTTVAGNGTPGFSGDGGPSTAAQLSGPTGIAFDAQGALYIADTENQRIRKVANGVISTVAGGGSTPGTRLSRPRSVAVDPAGILYVTDDGNQVHKISNGLISPAACDGAYGYVGDNVPALTAQCKYPGPLAVDAAGNLYFGDGNGYIRKVGTDGILHNIAGVGKQPGDGIPAIEALVGPMSLAVDAAGSIYIGQFGAVRKITGGIIDTIAGGVQFPPDDLFARSEALGMMPGLAADSQGRVYFSDSGHQTIRVLTPQAGTPLSIASVRNAASNLASGIAQGEIIAITGSGLGPSELATGTFSIDGVLDRQAGGAAVQINGVPAPIVYASAGQVAAVVPYGSISSGTPLLNRITVTYRGAVSNAAMVAGAQWQLGLFTANASGTGQAAAVNQDGTLNGAAHPAAPGSVISLYATGEGATTPEGIDGKPASAPLPKPIIPVTVTIGGETVSPEYAGGAPGEIAGLMQINVRIPNDLPPGAAVPVTVQATGSSTSQPGVTIAVGR